MGKYDEVLPQVEEMILQGLTFPEVHEELGINTNIFSTVRRKLQGKGHQIRPSAWRRGKFYYVEIDGQETCFTERLREILILAACGYDAMKSSSILHITYGTIKNHRRNIIQKMTANSFEHCIGIAFASGLLDSSTLNQDLQQILSTYHAEAS